MPVVVEFRGIKFKINPKDHPPPHVHVEGYGNKVRISLLTVAQMDETGFSVNDMRRILTVVRDNLLDLRESWEEYHG